MEPNYGFFETLALHPALFVGCCVVLGLLIGSFLNVVIYRVPIMMDNELREECAELASCEAEAAAAANAAPEVAAAPAAESAEAPVAVSIAAVSAPPEVIHAAQPADPPAVSEAAAVGIVPPAAPAEAVPSPKTARAYNLIVPRSACPACKTPIPAQENIPVVSWLMLGGKCSTCDARISPRYPIIELTTGVLSGYVAWKFGFGVNTLAVLAFTWFLIALTMIDFDTQFLPDMLTYPLLWLGLLMSLAHPAWAPGAAPLTPADSIIGAAVGYLSLWSVYWLFKLITGKEGMGYGDFKLFAALGAWLGWQMLLPVLIFASGVGALFGIVAIIRHRMGRDTQIPFGPFLSVAGWLALMFGHEFVAYYLTLDLLG